MLRKLIALVLLVTAPLAAQVTTPPVPPTPPVVLAPTVAPEPVTAWRIQSNLLKSSIDRAWAYADLASTYQNYAYNYNYDVDHPAPIASFGSNFASDFHWVSSGGPRAPWAKNDPADSLYRSARDLLNRGDYRRSAALFKELPQKFPSSVYVNDAMYWQAFALYRIGSTPELQEALAVLEALKAKAPPPSANKNVSRVYEDQSWPTSTKVTEVGAKFSTLDRLNLNLTFAVGRGENDATQLAARIATVLSQRGLANDAAVKRALAAGANSCDVEDQQVRSEALSALMRSDPEMARQSATKILTRRDECSVPLRQTAVSLVGNKRDEAAAAALIPIAKSDPSLQVRGTAIDYLGRMPGDAALNALQELAMSADDESIQRAAGRAIASSENPRSRAALRGLVEKKDASLALRVSAVDAFGRNSTAEDGAWLRAVYGRTTEPRVKSAIVRTVGRIGGDANDQWLSALVGNEDEPMEARMAALDQAGRSMDITALGKLYDGATQRQVRQTVVDLLSNRKEPAAVDKLIDIAKNGTDPSMRRAAISALARSKDPRAQKLLLELVDHE